MTENLTHEAIAQIRAELAALRAENESLTLRRPLLHMSPDGTVSVLECQSCAALRAERDELRSEYERLSAAMSHVVMQAGSQAQEARTEKSIVYDILRSLGLPLRDWEARRLVSEKFAAMHAEQALMRAERERTEDALKVIADWHLPPSGRQWDDGTEMSYFAAFGSNGERDYMRAIARKALDGNAKPAQEAT